MRSTSISQSLSAITSQTTFDLLKGHITTSYKDHLALAILRNAATCGYRIVAEALRGCDIAFLALRIERRALSHPIEERLLANKYYEDFIEALRNTVTAKSLSTAHALYFILGDSSTATSHVLSEAGLTTARYLEQLQHLVGVDRG